MKEVYFNELSSRRLCLSAGDEEKKMESFIMSFVALRDEGFKKVCFSEHISAIKLSATTTIYDYLKSHKRNNYAQLLLYNTSYPYIKPDTPEEDNYIIKDIKLCMKGRKIHSEGFSAAYLNNSLCISFLNNIFGRQLCYHLLVKEDGKEDCDVICLCITDKNQINEEQYQVWKVEKGYDSIPECETDASDKKVHLSPDHHGNHELINFCNRITKDPYIVSVLNSIDQDSNEKEFLRAYRGDGIIDVVLYKSSRGLALKLKTTARNKYEAIVISNHIEKKYY